MAKRRTIVLIRPLSGVFDSLYRVIPIALLAICRRLDLSRYEVVIVDQTIGGWRNRLADALQRDVLLVGITSLTGYQIYFGRLLAKHVRKFRSDVPIVWGGVHATAAPEQTLEDDLVDYVVIGEGEDTFPALVDVLAHGGDPSTLDGVGYKRDGNKIHVNPRRQLNDITELEDLPYELIDMDDYLKEIKDTDFYVEGARGCIYNCTFCYNPVCNERQWRPRSARRIVDNIERLYRAYGVVSFFISDDSFFISEERVEEFLSLLESRELPITWSCEGNLHFLSSMGHESLQRLAKSGLELVSIGVESGSERVRKFLNKPVFEPDLLEFNRSIGKYGITAQYNFITGTPIEEKGDLRQTVALVDRLLNENPHALVQSIYLTVPYPGTKYLDQCRENGLRPPESFAAWDDYDSFTIAKYVPWLRGNHRRMVEFLMYSSLFVDRKVEEFVFDSLFGRLVALLGKMYRPIARFRFTRLLYFPFPEGTVIKLVNLVQKKLIQREMRL